MTLEIYNLGNFSSNSTAKSRLEVESEQENNRLKIIDSQGKKAVQQMAQRLKEEKKMKNLLRY